MEREGGGLHGKWVSPVEERCRFLHGSVLASGTWGSVTHSAPTVKFRVLSSPVRQNSALTENEEAARCCCFCWAPPSHLSHLPGVACAVALSLFPLLLLRHKKLYGMKWARLMFGREFRVEAVMLLWDHIFASSWIESRPDMPECIESVAVAMVRAHGGRGGHSLLHPISTTLFPPKHVRRVESSSVH